MNYFVHIRGRTYRVQREGGVLRVDGLPVEVDLAPGRVSPVRSARVDGRSLRILPARNGRGGWILEIEGARYPVEVLDPGEEAIRRARKGVAASAGPSPVRAPMPGLIVRVEVAPGEIVTEGAGVVIMEAMKMENELRAPRAGKVGAVLVSPGDTVERDQVLVEFDPLEEEE